LPQTILLHGPVDSDRARRVQEFLHAEWGRCLLLVPAREYAARRLETLVRALSLPGVWGRPVQALADFARELLAGEGIEAARAGSFQRRLVLQRCIEQLRQSPEVNALGDVLELPGFVSHLLRMIVQFKQVAVEPADFRKIIDRRENPRDIDRAVAALYQAYQETLQSQDVYDVPGLFWQADLACRAGRPAVLEGIEVLLLDGFDDFTPSEFRLLESLAPHVQKLVIGLNYDANPDRRDVYYLPAQTLERIKKVFGPELETFSAHDAKCHSAYAARHIFWRSEPPAPAGLAANLRVVPCEDAVHEIEVIGRRIKTLIVEERVPVDQIAVLCPDMAAAAETIRGVFGEFGIPARVPQAPALAQSVFGGFVLRLIELAEHWERESVIDALQSPWFADMPPANADALPLLTRRAQIVSGYEEWRTRLESLQRRLTHTEQREVVDLLKRLPNAAKLLAHYQGEIERLNSLLALPEEAAPADYAGALRRLIQALHRHPNDPEETAVRSGLHAVLALLEDLPGERVSRQVFLSWFRRGCEETTYTRQQPRPAVSCLTLEAARNLHFEHVFVCGLNEGVFPRTLPINALYSEADMRELRDLGIALESRREQSAREQLLFHHALMAAQGTLTLTYALRDRQGREALSSPYLKDVLELFEGHAQVREAEPVADTFVPRPAEVACPRDLRNSALYNGLELSSVEETLSALTAAADAGATIEKQRHDASAFGTHDAVLQDPEITAAIAARFDETHRFSVSALESYLECPFHFFEKQILDIDPSEAPLPELDAAMRGSLMHDVLCRFHTRYRGTPIAEIPEEEALTTMRVTVDEVFQERGWQAAAAPPGVLRVEQARMNVLLTRYLKLERNPRSAQWRPEYFEVDFGMEKADEAPSTVDPFVYPTSAGQVLFRGRIDRIDLNGDQARIIDYKTGSMPQPKDINAGYKVQLSIYAKALEELVLPDRTCAEACFLKVGYSDRQDALACGRKKEDRAAREENTSAQIAQAVQQIRAGWFAPLRRGKTCYGCGHARPCRYDKGRMLLKAPDIAEDEEECEDEE
jgi:ATP-dependent helicase/DNAse subunit B